MFKCQSADSFSVLWPPEEPRYRVTFGPKHNYESERALDWWCSCADTQFQRYAGGPQRPHKDPAMDARYCKHVHQVKAIRCGWTGDTPAWAGGKAYCPKCGLPATEVPETVIDIPF